MANVKLSKFPVTAPDGTEYRVKFHEEWDDLWGRTMVVTLYVRNKIHLFRRVGGRRFIARELDYDRKSPDYVGMASTAVREYAEASEMKKAAAERFTKWDGRIAE